MSGMSGYVPSCPETEGFVMKSLDIGDKIVDEEDVYKIVILYPESDMVDIMDERGVTDRISGELARKWTMSR